MKYDYLYYVEMFKEGVFATQNIDYGKPADVKKNNKGVKQYRRSVELINKHYPDRLFDFSTFLKSSDKKLKICCAVCLVELTDASIEIKRNACNAIKEHMTSCEKYEKMGWDVWMKSYEVV